MESHWSSSLQRRTNRKRLVGLFKEEDQRDSISPPLKEAQWLENHRGEIIFPSKNLVNLTNFWSNLVKKCNFLTKIDQKRSKIDKF